jgi:hypothetical protein
MDGSEEEPPEPGTFIDFTVKIAKSGADLQNGDVEVIDLRCEVGKALKIGRATKSDVPVMSPGISWVHAEFRAVPRGGEGEGLRLTIRDISSNGTGLELPGKTLERVPKGEDQALKDGMMVAMPMRLKSPDDQRFFTVHITDSVDSPVANVEKTAEEKAKRDSVQDIDSDSPGMRHTRAKNEAVSSPRREAAADSRDTVLQEKDGDEEPASKRARKSLPMPKSARSGEEDSYRTSPVGGGVELPPYRPPSGPPGVMPGVRPPLARGARPKGAAGPPRPLNAADVPAELREKMQAGEAIIRDAKEFEDRNQWGQAFDNYQRGLANFMEVLPKLGKDSPGGISLRNQINGYLTRAGELKEKLERSKAFGCRKAARPRGPATT